MQAKLQPWKDYKSFCGKEDLECSSFLKRQPCCGWEVHFLAILRSQNVLLRFSSLLSGYTIMTAFMLILDHAVGHKFNWKTHTQILLSLQERRALFCVIAVLWMVLPMLVERCG